MEDKNGVKIRKGSVVDIHQTVNGQNMFVVLDDDPMNLDIRYAGDLLREYEYDKRDLMEITNFSHHKKEIEVVGNVYCLIGVLNN